ncbi:MAG: mammalian cell entry protein, partial [Mycobacterium sp.]
MSPRRKFAPGQGLLLVPTARRAWRLMVVALASAICMAVAITVSASVLSSHDAHRKVDRREQAAKGYVEWFMTQFTTLDPFHANAYVTRVLAQATGDFAKHFTDKANQIIVQVARAEPTTGTVLEVGLERWN